MLNPYIAPPNKGFWSPHSSYPLNGLNPYKHNIQCTMHIIVASIVYIHEQNEQLCNKDGLHLEKYV